MDRNLYKLEENLAKRQLYSNGTADAWPFESAV